MDERLGQAIADLGPNKWAAFALDEQAQVVWVSDELKAFLGTTDDRELGVGRHVVAAFLEPAWQNSITPESGVELFRQIYGYLRALGLGAVDVSELPEGFEELLADLPEVPARSVLTGTIEYVTAGLPAYDVEYFMPVLRGEDGDVIGAIVLTNVAVRPTLLARLGRGDSSMYERMVALTEPARHETAIVFADLEGSGELSRQMPTAAYFDLIRSLTSSFDLAIAERAGIIGKHVGDGWTAFILASDAGGVSAAAAGAVASVRALQAATASLTASLGETLGAEFELRVNAGLHWGAGVYLGQLVPGGRLEVTALGDEVNECARIQECARGGRILASKQLMELLAADDAAAIGVDPARLTYERLAVMDTATDKTRRDAAAIAVTAVPPQAV
jgi:class 3 adenylate cyclase